MTVTDTTSPKTTEERIAKIERTFLGVEDGIFTVMLHVTLDEPHRVDGKSRGRVGTAYGMEFIRRTMAACGVDSWEKVTGRTVIVVCENGQPLGIKPLPTERGEPFMFGDLSTDFGDHTGQVERQVERLSAALRAAGVSAHHVEEIKEGE